MTQMLDVLRGLRSITATPGRGCTRIAYTHYEDQAHDYVWERLRDVPGLRRVHDAAGNMFVVPEAPVTAGHPHVLIGSHLDTVIEGGWLDGSLGVVAAMHVLSQRVGLGADVSLVVFRDEEGVRFNTGLFGSKVFAGRCQPTDLDATDGDGVRVRDVVPDPAGCCDYRPPVDPSVFLECHIEQGARLVTREKRVGMVTAIVGIRRFALIGTGSANHAGTTDMLRREDALVPVAEIIGRLPTLVEGIEDAVITCGRLSVQPGAPNVIPGRVTAIVEMRAQDESTLDTIEQRLRGLVDQARGSRAAEVELQPSVVVPSAPTDPEVQACLEAVLATRSIPFDRLASMAGHDTQQAGQRCAAGMFFIPSIDGVSHNPAEDSRYEDVELAGDIMLAWAEACLARCS